MLFQYFLKLIVIVILIKQWKLFLNCSINFLKYQPPPKNLDYLQNSEVYRLVHDMEPPIRGISNRAEKILAEQDYYDDKRSA